MGGFAPLDHYSVGKATKEWTAAIGAEFGSLPLRSTRQTASPGDGGESNYGTYSSNYSEVRELPPPADK